jgi:hypothetical protein
MLRGVPRQASVPLESEADLGKLALMRIPVSNAVSIKVAGAWCIKAGQSAS